MGTVRLQEFEATRGVDNITMIEIHGDDMRQMGQAIKNVLCLVY